MRYPWCEFFGAATLTGGAGRMIAAFGFSHSSVETTPSLHRTTARRNSFDSVEILYACLLRQQ
jgi:hypothetical protein